MGDLVTLTVEDGVGIVQLNRPPMNAINVELTRDLVAITNEVTGRDDIGAVVLWGGERVFAAGADVKMMSGQSPLQIDAMITGLQDAFNLFEEIPKVTIAAIAGVALGGGLELAMCADFRFAAQDSRLGQPEIKLGVIPGAGGTQRLPRLVGPARAKDIIYSGRFVGAEEALRIGLVDAVSTTEEVFRNAVEAARRYARGPRAALRSAKVAVNWGARGDLRTGLILERQLFASLFATEDQTEGMNAFIEKRDAAFTGR